MTKVSITVAAHSVEVDADSPLSEVAFVAMRLYRDSALPARQMAVGFDNSGLVTDRADLYAEPQPEEYR